VLYHIIKHIYENVLLVSSHRLDDKPLILGKEEEWTTLAHSFSWLEDAGEVVFKVQRLHDVGFLYPVEFHYSLEFLLLVADDFSLETYALLVHGGSIVWSNVKILSIAFFTTFTRSSGISD
jgi:hypothetical protein